MIARSIRRACLHWMWHQRLWASYGPPVSFSRLRLVFL